MQRAASSSSSEHKDYRISQATLKEIIRLNCKNPKIKISDEALKVFGEFVHVFILEASKRSIKQAMASDLKKVEIEHVEKILPQLMLDFT